MRRILDFLSPRLGAPLQLAAALVLVACADSGTAPRRPLVEYPATPVLPTYNLTGTVIEHTALGAFPRPFFAFRLLSLGAPAGGADTIVVATGSDGRYLASARGNTTILLPLAGVGYHAPCSGRNAISSLDPDRVADFHVVSDSVLSTTGMPASLRTTVPYVNGRVIDSRTGQPVAGASITFTEYLSGGTLTDAQGRFLLCVVPPGAGSGQSMTVRAEKAGYLSDSRFLEDPFFFGQNLELVLASY